MARPKEFDREVVLERAMNFFWEHGYEAASLRDLLAAMGIGRQSLYDTFGDKRNLFLASLDHYYALTERHMLAPLRAPDGGLEAIEEYFRRVSHNMSTKPYRACLLINSAIELAPHDIEVGTIVNRFVKDLRHAFAAALEVARRRGQIRSQNIEAKAWHLTNSAMGFAPMSRARVPLKGLKLVSEQVVNTIRA